MTWSSRPWAPPTGWQTSANRRQNPTPPAANLSVWLDGNDVDGLRNTTLANNDPVTTWVNKGSILESPTQGGASTLKPTFIASGIASRACLRFDGGDFLQAATAANYTFMHDGNGCTAYVVCRSNTSAVQNLLATTTGSAALVGMGIRTQTTFRANFFITDGVGTQINANSAVNALSTNLFDVYTTIVFDDVTDYNAYVNNGASVASANVASAFPAGAPAAGLTVGSGSGGGSGFTGDIAQVLVYSAVHDASQRSAVQAFLVALYGSFPVP